MPYSERLTRANPACLIFLLDQSSSMDDPFGGETRGRKADALADAFNKVLFSTVVASTRTEGVRDYFYVAVIGYGAKVGPAFGGALAGRQIVPISEIADNPIRVDQRTRKVSDGVGGLTDEVIKFEVWVDPVVANGTPMCEALRYADRIVSNWLSEHPTCYPPLVLNITDGESTDGDPTSIADSLRAMASDDGNVLLFNLHLSSSPSASIAFPDSEARLPDEYARLLFRISSPLPDGMITAARKLGYQVSEGARGFIFNADVVKLVQFLDIGTQRDLR
jgi:hypothetical protein